jgi:hypothetical protein
MKEGDRCNSHQDYYDSGSGSDFDSDYYNDYNYYCYYCYYCYCSDNCSVEIVDDGIVVEIGGKKCVSFFLFGNRHSQFQGVHSLKVSQFL